MRLNSECESPNNLSGASPIGLIRFGNERHTSWPSMHLILSFHNRGSLPAAREVSKHKKIILDNIPIHAMRAHPHSPRAPPEAFRRRGGEGGACGCGSQPHLREAPGHRPPQLLGAARKGWTRTGRTRAKAWGIRGQTLPSGPGSTVPRPKIAASGAPRGERADRKARTAPHTRGILVRLPAPHSPHFISRRRKGRRRPRRRKQYGRRSYASPLPARGEREQQTAEPSPNCHASTYSLSCPRRRPSSKHRGCGLFSDSTLSACVYWIVRLPGR
jgi:hypothetical protein